MIAIRKEKGKSENKFKIKITEEYKKMRVEITRQRGKTVRGIKIKFSTNQSARKLKSRKQETIYVAKSNKIRGNKVNIRNRNGAEQKRRRNLRVIWFMKSYYAVEKWAAEKSKCTARKIENLESTKIMSEINNVSGKANEKQKKDAINKKNREKSDTVRGTTKILSMNQMKNKNRKTGRDDDKRITKLKKFTRAH
jgi:hypothetical protein